MAGAENAHTTKSSGRGKGMTKRGMITLAVITVFMFVIEPIAEKGLKAYLEDLAVMISILGVAYFVKWWFAG